MNKYHEDCETPLDADGRCPHCGYVVDTQSVFLSAPCGKPGSRGGGCLRPRNHKTAGCSETGLPFTLDLPLCTCSMLWKRAAPQGQHAEKCPQHPKWFAEPETGEPVADLIERAREHAGVGSAWDEVRESYEALSRAIAEQEDAARTRQLVKALWADVQAMLLEMRR